MSETTQETPQIQAPVAPAAEAPPAAETTVAAPDANVPAAQEVPATDAPVTAPVETPAEAPKESTLLATVADEVTEPAKEDKTVEDAPVEKPAEEKPADTEPKKEEASQSDETAPLPTYESFTLPEGFEMDDAKLSEFTQELGEFERLTKADHAEMQKFGQKLVERHTAAVQETINRLAEAQTAYWEKTKAEWKEAVASDPEIGGNRLETTRDNVRRFLQTHGGSAEDRKAFSTFMNDTGFGDNPMLVKMIARAGALLAEGVPLAATKGSSAPVSKLEKRYGKIS